MNQYSWNLDAPQDYLAHGKLGAHYSKNWTKEKQNEYNQWYDKTHKDELKKKRVEYGVDPVSKQISRFNEDAQYDAESRHYERSQYANDRESEIAQAKEHLYAARKEATDRKQRMLFYLRDVDKDKDKLSNKVLYDVTKTSSTIAKNIQSSINKVADRFLSQKK